MDSLETQLKIPDLWQQKAIRALQGGKDVIVASPTGAGKTYIFELLMETGFQGKAVYTVPTRALANDKRLEWKRRGWDVGITTGDRNENPDARVVVATLETQKGRLVRGEGPDLLVVDEYQMLGDEQRGLNYELSIASAPAKTQLLLLSGSVGNPKNVADWLIRLGRKVELVQHSKRPVPLEEIQIEGLPNRIPTSVRGLWPRAIAKVLKAGMAPLLAFAPRRKAAEDLAFEIARMLPEEDPIVLTPEQERLAGDGLKGLLRARVAFHHSGLDYAQRAGLIEPLAKAGQLRVVVATMGLAAGINFSMRSVLVTDREYRSGDRVHEVRPDELLQMFGRAGRRGMDKVGYIAVAPGKPRLQEARPLRLKRSNQIDWPSITGLMQTAIEKNQNPMEAAHQLTRRLFSVQRIPLGLADFHAGGPSASPVQQNIVTQTVTEFQTPDNDWERKRAPRRAELGIALYWFKDEWRPALSVPEMLTSLPLGTLCRLNSQKPPEYGRQVPIARFGTSDTEGELVLNRWILRAIREQPNSKGRKHHWRRMRWTLDRIEKQIIPLLPAITMGGTFVDWRESKGMLYARLHYRKAITHAQVDSANRPLISPPERLVSHETDLTLPGDEGTGSSGKTRTAADIWFSLGLIDKYGAPTQRGILFSFFNYGEGLAIAAALEDRSYALEDLMYDLANLRAGHRFSFHEAGSGRLGAACRAAYGLVSHTGYLIRGLPTTYGEGASEVLFQPGALHALNKGDMELRTGDIERARLEWKSILRHIAHCPKLNWDRWLDLRALAKSTVKNFPKEATLESLPGLTSKQQQRHKSFLTFEHSPLQD
ncbi:DEAD/DEAH box helicase [Puniceicoccales bacterium CK1056]|uniref:DEAD/DEAH box helicase n=1 Tax=Oceanipulchritudo coccoides TaxID=2706888 RepID=A0A6B2LYU3_9BACT|nr:DEAD/DEAH box helicase [Oceanipulchritudo coccoides]NDV61332.1 DEAD/DEAH box helicase [Oceanipulchritudo coccoides]